jgi:Zn-dependent protease with chaperone function
MQFVSTPNPHLTTDHSAVSVIAMYIIAITFVLMVALVLAVEGLDGLPFGIWGLVGSIMFIVAALLMAQYVKRQPH